MSQRTNAFELLESRQHLSTVEFADPTYASVFFEGTGYATSCFGDFNGDGRDDVVIRGGRSSGLILFDAAVDGTLGNRRTIDADPINNLRHSDVASADMNGDGRDELLVTKSRSNGNMELRVYGFGPTGTPQLNQTRLITGTTGFAAGDFNNDGRDDVVIARRAGSDSASRLSVLFNQNGRLEAPRLLRGTYGALRDVVSDDFTGDGRDDIAMTDSDGYLRVITARSRNRFGAVEHRYVGGTRLSSLITGDINNDRRADLIVSGAGMTSADPNAQGEIDLFTTASDGRLSLADAIDLDGAVGIALADMDGDSHADLVAQGLERTVLIFFGDGSGTMNDSQEIDGTSFPSTTVFGTADLNGDGRDDLIELDTYQANLVAYLNLGVAD